MRNCDKYKTVDELKKAFSEFCATKKECKREYCKYSRDNCEIQFALDECAEENNKEKKYRPYTLEEAVKELRGFLCLNDGNGMPKNVPVRYSVNEGIIETVNGYYQETLIRIGAKINGKPFGMEVTE